MKIEKAIKILSDSYYKHTILLAGKDDEALKLGIEALKRLKAQRLHGFDLMAGGLPGETKE